MKKNLLIATLCFFSWVGNAAYVTFSENNLPVNLVVTDIEKECKGAIANLKPGQGVIVKYENEVLSFKVVDGISEPTSIKRCWAGDLDDLWACAKSAASKYGCQIISRDGGGWRSDDCKD